MSRDEILEEIVVRPRFAYVPLPDMQVIERPGWRQLITPSVKRGGFNEVSLAQLTDDEADEVIDRTIAQYKDLGCKFVWRVGPGSTPADLPARLARRGMIHGVGCGMARSTDIDDRVADDITVEIVDSTTVEAFTNTMAAGWNMDPASIAPANRIVARMRDEELASMRHEGLERDGEHARMRDEERARMRDEDPARMRDENLARMRDEDLPRRGDEELAHRDGERTHARDGAHEPVGGHARPPTHTLWVARCGGEPAATAGAVLFDRSIYLVGGVVLDGFRGRGLYRALVAARMRYARERGVMLATSHARAETSAPILERLGFETLCRYDNFSSVV